jgi:glycosyltransferase involved in cell wall biosynthesis
MAGLLADPDRRRGLGRAGREWVEETMDLERSLDRYVALYRELALSSSGARALRP